MHYPSALESVNTARSEHLWNAILCRILPYVFCHEMRVCIHTGKIIVNEWNICNFSSYDNCVGIKENCIAWFKQTPIYGTTALVSISTCYGSIYSDQSEPIILYYSVTFPVVIQFFTKNVAAHWDIMHILDQMQHTLYKTSNVCRVDINTVRSRYIAVICPWMIHEKHPIARP